MRAVGYHVRVPRRFPLVLGLPDVHCLPGTDIELYRPHPGRRRPRCAVFDFDGTLSLIRGGWIEIMVGMMLEGLRDLPRSTESAAALKAHVTDFVLTLNGQPTIFQMQRYVEEMAARGGRPEAPAAYHREYLRRLGEKVDERKARIRSGAAAPDDLLVPGARSFLSALAEVGIELTLASGTEIDFIREESRVLNIDHFFENRIFGPDASDPRSFSKLLVMEALLTRHGITGETLIGIGDGVVETEYVVGLGGVAVGVASDETQRSGRMESWKHSRLVAVGAHVMVPDYRHTAELTAWLLDAPVA